MLLPKCKQPGRRFGMYRKDRSSAKSSACLYYHLPQFMLNSDIFQTARGIQAACGLPFIHIHWSNHVNAHLRCLYSCSHCIHVLGNELVCPMFLWRPAKTSVVDVTKGIFTVKAFLHFFANFTSNKLIILVYCLVVGVWFFFWAYLCRRDLRWTGKTIYELWTWKRIFAFSWTYQTPKDTHFASENILI